MNDQEPKHDRENSEPRKSPSTILTHNMEENQTDDDEHQESFTTRLKSNLSSIADVYLVFLVHCLVFAAVPAFALLGTLFLTAPIFYGMWEVYSLLPWELLQLEQGDPIPRVYFIAEFLWLFVVLPLAWSVIITLAGGSDD